MTKRKMDISVSIKEVGLPVSLPVVTATRTFVTCRTVLEKGCKFCVRPDNPSILDGYRCTLLNQSLQLQYAFPKDSPFWYILPNKDCPFVAEVTKEEDEKS